jgi:hypothetical protein
VNNGSTVKRNCDESIESIHDSCVIVWLQSTCGSFWKQLKPGRKGQRDNRKALFQIPKFTLPERDQIEDIKKETEKNPILAVSVFIGGFLGSPMFTNVYHSPSRRW